MTYTPTTRKPTGLPAAPLVICSGLAKSGKSLTAYQLAYSELIDTCWIADFGEGSADEYGDPEVHEVLEWGSSWSDLADTIAWCVKQKPAEGKMNALILDSGTEVWDGLKDRASKRARSSDKARAKLKDDPDAEIDVSTNYWNDAKTAWARIINPLKLCGHLVGVVIVRQEVVAEFVNDRPTKNKVVSYQCEKTLQGAATAHINIDMDHAASLIEVRSKHVSVPKAGLKLGANPLEEVIRMLSPTNVFAAPDVRVAVDGVDDFWDLLVEHKDDEIGAAMRTLADTSGKVLRRANLLADGEWLRAARAHLDHLVVVGLAEDAHIPEGAVDPAPAVNDNEQDPG